MTPNEKLALESNCLDVLHAQDAKAPGVFMDTPALVLRTGGTILPVRRALIALEDAGYIVSMRYATERGPLKRIYALTHKGRLHKARTS